MRFDSSYYSSAILFQLGGYPSHRMCFRELLLFFFFVSSQEVFVCVWNNVFLESLVKWLLKPPKLLILEKYFYLSSPEDMFIDLKRGEGREKRRDRNINVREKHQSVASCTHLGEGLNLQPQHILWLGIEPVILQLQDDAPTRRATLARARTIFINWFKY